MAIDRNTGIRVLVVSANPFSDVNNNGKTLKSIFSAFPKDSLFEFYTRPQDNVIGDGTYAKSYYAVSESDIIRSLLHCSKKCGGVQVFETERNLQLANDKIYRGFLKGRLKKVRWLRSLLWKTRRWDNADFREWYTSCEPDIVFALLGGPGACFTIAQEISSRLNIPLAVYFTDDYLIHWPAHSWMDRIRRRKDAKAFRQLVAHSSIGFCIGEMMCAEYSSYFGKRFYPIMNSVEIKPFSYVRPGNQLPRISYFGSLWLDRWRMLRRLAASVSGIAEIRVYSGNELTPEMERAFHESGIHFEKAVTGEAYRDAVSQSDVLLHVESDSRENRAKTALSISTKIPDYLASGKPVLAYGPVEVASFRLLKDNAIGFVLSSEDTPEVCRQAVASFLSDASLQQSYAERGYAFAEANFDRQKISARVRELLTDVVNGSVSPSDGK